MRAVPYTPKFSDAADSAETVAPSCCGQKNWTLDPDLRGLLRLCFLEGTFTHFARHWDRIGELAGDRLDELAATADQNAPILHTHDRFGHIAEGQQAFAELLRIDPNFLI